ncbi:MAG TPA: Crp/Fnr family transcriptional regulator [Chloroflexota bacterium]|nr:Crp/Fnr family transcriptional regulator [Chloroflexota bacterium]
MMAGGALQRLPLFAGLPPETARLLESGAQKRSFRRGEVIFHKGDPGTSMYLIVEGQVKIVLPSDTGDEALLGVLDVGDFFGELSLIDGQPRSATIVATEPTDTIVLHRDEFLRVIRANPNVAIDMLRVLARRLRETDEFVEDAVFLDVPGRLAKKLLELADAYGATRADGTVIGLRLTQAELANMVGATRESVNKHLRSYRSRGIIDVDRQRIVIRRPDELQRRIY